MKFTRDQKRALRLTGHPIPLLLCIDIRANTFGKKEAKELLEHMGHILREATRKKVYSGDQIDESVILFQLRRLDYLLSHQRWYQRMWYPLWYWWNEYECFRHRWDDPKSAIKVCTECGCVKSPEYP